MSGVTPEPESSVTVTPAPAPAKQGITLHLPGTKVPSGTIYNDLIALATAVVAILKAFGVI